MDSKPFGLTYEEHIINYWKFILPIPTNQNPAEDPTGEQCTKGQNVSNSSIFYLHGNSGGQTEKTCRIPAGLGLFIPIIQAEDSTGETPGATIDELIKNVKRDQDRVSALDLTINEKEFKYEDLKNFRVPTKDFNVIFPENNIFSANPGPATAVTDGYQVITTPLTPGNYTIHFKGATQCLGTEDPTCVNFASDNIYHLIVS